MNCVSTLKLAVFIVVGFWFFVDHRAAPAAESGVAVQNGSVVSMEYTLTDDKGQVMDTSKGKPPLVFTKGSGQIIPGLDKELLGMKVGQEKKVQVKPEDGYGPVNPAAFQEVPKDKLPPEALKVGTMLMASGPQGQPMPVRVHEIKDSTVIVDFNHPMAGKTLFFDIKVVDIKKAGDKAAPKKQ